MWQNWRRSLLTCTAMGLAMWGLSAATHARVQRDSARVYVTVLGGGNKPVTGLTEKDFTIKEDGEVKKVISAGPATEPMSVELLTDRFGLDNTYSVFDVRLALSTIVQTLHKGNPDTQIAFTTFDGAAVRQVKPTTGTVELEAFIKKLFTNGNSPVLLEAVADASVALEHAPTDRRIIFAVFAGYKNESSTIPSPPVINAIYKARASMWMLEGRSAFQVNPTSIDRETIGNRACVGSGGLRDTVGVGTALQSRGKRMAELIVAQYAVVYGAPSVSATSLEITVPIKDAKIIGPHWPPR